MTRFRAVALAAVAVGSACDVGPAAQIPAFDATDAEPQVAERLAGLRAVVEAHPDSAPAWGLLGLSLQAHGFPEAAVEAYSVARKLRPGTFAYAYFPATVLGDRGDPAAGELFARARRLRPDYVPARLREARWHLEQGHPEHVFDLLDDSLVIGGAPAEAHLILGQASLAQGHLDESRSHLETAVAREPRIRGGQAQLAEVYRRLDLFDQAKISRLRSITFREEAQTEDPVLALLYAEGVSSRWYIVRGQGSLAAGEPEAAIGAFERAVELRPEDAHGWNQLGIAQQVVGDYAAAGASHGRALELRPEFPNAIINLAAAQFLGGDPEAGLMTARQAVESDTTAAQAYLNLGMFEHALGRSDAASAAYAAGLSRAAFDTRIAIRLAWIMATDRAAALRDGRRAVVLAETVNEIEGYLEPASLDVLAAAYAETGAFDDAVSASRRAEGLATQRGDAGFVSNLRQRTAMYVRGEPYRE